MSTQEHHISTYYLFKAAVYVAGERARVPDTSIATLETLFPDLRRLEGDLHAAALQDDAYAVRDIARAWGRSWRESVAHYKRHLAIVAGWEPEERGKDGSKPAKKHSRSRRRDTTLSR